MMVLTVKDFPLRDAMSTMAFTLQCSPIWPGLVPPLFLRLDKEASTLEASNGRRHLKVKLTLQHIFNHILGYRPSFLMISIATSSIFSQLSAKLVAAKFHESSSPIQASEVCGWLLAECSVPCGRLTSFARQSTSMRFGNSLASC